MLRNELNINENDVKTEVENSDHQESEGEAPSSNISQGNSQENESNDSNSEK